MPSRRHVVVAAVAVCLLPAALMVGFGPGRHVGDPGRPTAGPTRPAPPTTAPGAPGASPGASPDEDADERATAVAGHEAAPTPDGSPSAPGYRLPRGETDTAGPLTSSASPGSTTARGRLVAGFPAALRPPAGATLETSSLTVSGGRVQAVLVFSGGEPGAVVEHYRALLTGRGFVERPVQGVENDPAAAFGRGRSSVTIAVRDGRTYLLAHLPASP